MRIGHLPTYHAGVMTLIRKLLLFPLLLVIACVLAGGYGALHNQISYTVSPEYFTEFKFHQFRIAEHLPDRLGAAIVGWNAAWWMGLVIGAVLIPCGWFIQGSANYFWAMIRVFGVVATTTLVVGLVALLLSFATIDENLAGQISRNGNAIQDDVAFARAGMMHNFSYLGGLIGILTGGITIYWQPRCVVGSHNGKLHPATEPPIDGSQG